MSPTSSTSTSSGPQFRVAILGYGPEARDQALRLRAANHQVTIGMRPGGMSWVRASEDGFTPQPSSAAVAGADIVVVLVPEEDQPAVYANAVAQAAPKDALLVFARGHALHTGAIDPKDHDVVLITADCRVATYRDVTGKALDRAVAYAHAAFGADARIGTTTVAEEVEADLAAFEARVGGPEALLEELERVLADSTHEPDCAKLGFYERLRALVARRYQTSGARPVRPAAAPSSVPSVTDLALVGMRAGRLRGVA